LAFAPITRLSSLLDAGAVDPVGLAELFLDRARGVGKPLNAYVTLMTSEAMTQARRSSERRRGGRRIGPLDGIPFALKDNIEVAGQPTTNGLGGPPRVAVNDAVVTERLLRAGAVLLGKLNMHEAALGGTTDNPHHGRTHNPFRVGYSPGGSSGGAGAAVAAGLCAAALGTDTAGSIRLPASYCGVVGMKPSAGRISTVGIAPLHRRLDHVGPLTRTVADAGLVMAALMDRHMPWSARPVPQSLTGRTICVLDNFTNERIEPEVEQAFDDALDVLERLGARIVNTRLTAFDPEAVRYAMFLLVEAGAAFEHAARLEQERERYSRDLVRCIEYGRRMSAVHVLKQEYLVADAAAQLLACFATADVVVTPATPQAAFAFDQDGLENLNTFCTLANFAGCPAVSLPMGANASGLPLGLQLMGGVGRDEEVLAMAGAYEAAAGHRLLPASPFGPEG